MRRPFAISFLFSLFLFLPVPSPAQITLGPDIFSTNEVSTASEESATMEAGPFDNLTLKGTKIITFRSRSVEGSPEGLTEGNTSSRDESLRLSISGRAADTDVDATIINTSTSGMDPVLDREDKVSIMLKRGPLKAYWGDFIADFDGLEFTRVDKVLSGLKVNGDYGLWSFMALASSPKGEPRTARMYGDGTQGPYPLGYSPVVVDSERVHVDGVLKTRGVDYDIDYEGGTVTFRNATIISTSAIKVDFDFRSTPYQHTTYGLRLRAMPGEDRSLGITYINDSDSLNGAKETRQSMTLDPVDPMSHYVIGMDGSYDLGPAVKLESEVAYSEKNPNLLASSTGEVWRDGAFKVKTTSDLGPLSLVTRLKRIGPKFETPADPDPKQDLVYTGADVGYKPNDLFYTGGSFNNENYLQGGVRYKNNAAGARASITPTTYSSISYFFSQLEESNDPVTGDTIDRLTTRNAGEATFTQSFLKHIVIGSNERRFAASPSEEVTVYKILGYGVSTLGLDNFSASGNLEVKETEEPDGGKPIARTYDLNISASPVREYFASLSFNEIDDTVNGVTTVTDLGYRAEPMSAIRSEGKYTISTIVEDFGSTPEVVSKQAGSLRMDVRPIGELRLRHTYRPNFTIMHGSGLLSYSDNVNQSEMIWSPIRELSAGAIYKVEDMFSLDKESIALERADERSDTKSSTLSLKSAPVRIMSIELNYTNEDSNDLNLISPEASLYDEVTGNVKIAEAVIRTSLSEQFSVDSRYMNTKTIDLSDNASSEVDILAQAASLKLTWNINESWSVYGSGAYSDTLDRLADDDPFTYALSPGIGFIYRLANTLRIEGSYSYSRSYLAAETEKSFYNVKLKYDANDYVHVNLNYDEEISRAPDYRVTDILGNVEIDL
jgi:hypothetical protein